MRASYSSACVEVDVDARRRRCTHTHTLTNAYHRNFVPVLLVNSTVISNYNNTFAH